MNWWAEVFAVWFYLIGVYLTSDCPRSDPDDPIETADVWIVSVLWPLVATVRLLAGLYRALGDLVVQDDPYDDESLGL